METQPVQASHFFGALEFAARYSELSVDDAAFPVYANPAASARKAKAWAVGANWYLARAIKVVVDYEHTTFAGGAAVGDRRAENFVATLVRSRCKRTRSFASLRMTATW